MAESNVAERLADELGGCLTRTDQHGDADWMEWDARRAAEVIREAQALAVEAAAAWLAARAGQAQASNLGLLPRAAGSERLQDAAALLRSRAAELRATHGPRTGYRRQDGETGGCGG
jgi:hypothetical protein